MHQVHTQLTLVARTGRAHCAQTEHQAARTALRPRTRRAHCTQAAHTLRALHPGRAQAARTALRPRTHRALGRVVARIGAVSCPCLGRVAACGRPCRRHRRSYRGLVLSRARARCCTPYRALYHHTGRHVARLQRRIVALPAPCRACLAIQPNSQAARCIGPTRPPPQPQYNLYRDSPWPGHALVTIQTIVS